MLCCSSLTPPLSVVVHPVTAVMVSHGVYTHTPSPTTPSNFHSSFVFRLFFSLRVTDSLYMMFSVRSKHLRGLSISKQLELSLTSFPSLQQDFPRKALRAGRAL